jgi:hypothetical protein
MQVDQPAGTGFSYKDDEGEYDHSLTQVRASPALLYRQCSYLLGCGPCSRVSTEFLQGIPRVSSDGRTFSFLSRVLSTFIFVIGMAGRRIFRGTIYSVYW